MKKNTYATMEDLNTLSARVDSIDSKIDRLLAALEGKKPAPATKSSEPKVPYTNSDGVTKMVSPAQAAAWTAWGDKAGDRKAALDHAKACSASFKFTKEHDAYIKANPSTTLKQFQEKFGHTGCKREMLRVRKVELGVR